MTPRPTNKRFLLFAFACLPLVLMAPGPERPGAPAAGAPAKAEVIRHVDLITPGTVIDKTAPKGWTHLVLKSQPRLSDAERKKVGDTTARLATLIFTATTATVESHGDGDARRYRLARLGLGVGVNIHGQDIVVSPETQARLGANLGFLAKQVVSGVYERQKGCRLVAVGQALAVMDTPAFMPRGRGHSPVVMRYVFLVDPRGGRLDTLVWRIDTDGKGGYEGAVGTVEWLAPNKMVDAEMQSDLNEFRLGVPSERAFAVKTIPHGQRQFSLPDGLREVAGAAKLSPEQAGRLTQALRDMVRDARASAAR